MTKLKVLLVDDHEVVRKGLKYVLDDLEDFTLVGEASSAKAAIIMVKELYPDVVILDIRMPGGSGLDACRAIHENNPDISIIMLTSYADDELIAEAIQAGAIGYILKDGSTDKLVSALTAIKNGEGSLDPGITRKVLDMMQRKPKEAHPFTRLSEREMEVLLLVSQGKTNAAIAEDLILSEKTIRNYISSVFLKLNVRNRVEAAIFAVQNRIQDYR
ncbi:MAG: response regulator transcription factor [Anaerolineae bacterium]|jgi:two-component system, NarL family, response regulator DevR|nr:response regulator transcription factor [Anaerolineae bacterium]MBT7073306.1 response regulator transcription factor [Anaerolineae bacterium]MBT7782758.1 response regulator transcription factor [Anaerolineae bacterium]